MIYLICLFRVIKYTNTHKLKKDCYTLKMKQVSEPKKQNSLIYNIYNRNRNINNFIPINKPAHIYIIILSNKKKQNKKKNRKIKINHNT